jgi:hypothetical protein
MLLHHTRTVLGSGENSPAQGIVVPLDLPEVQILGQEIQPNSVFAVFFARRHLLKKMVFVGDTGAQPNDLEKI